jgi:Ca2+-binding RTX toxin-like protein
VAKGDSIERQRKLLGQSKQVKRLAILAIAVLVIGCSTQPEVVKTADDQIEHPVIRKPLTEVGTNGNDDLITPFDHFGQQDTVYVLNGRDQLFGDNGDDELYGGNGPDRILGDFDKDYIVGGQGQDYLSGNAHADIIEAADAQIDGVYCGNGEKDKASVDEEDEVGGCEFVNGERVAAG